MNEEQYLKEHEDERTKCEIFSRVMGYHRAIEYWNDGKQSEYRDRKQFKESVAVSNPLFKMA